MTKNILIAVLTFLLFASLFIALVYKAHADRMTALAEVNVQLAEQAKIESAHARIMVQEALKEASLQREQAAVKIAFLEAQLQKRSQTPYKEK